MPSGPKNNAPAAAATPLATVAERSRAVMERVKEAMLELMENEEAAPTARATAARALALIERDLPTEGVDASRSLDTMSVAELDAEIAAELQRRANGGPSHVLPRRQTDEG